ncbi:MAG TPA: hypothetical protein H9672_05810 [Firmicutes bacterium]|nr:hypothetical protein [Bacillota bacterium]
MRTRTFLYRYLAARRERYFYHGVAEPLKTILNHSFERREKPWIQRKCIPVQTTGQRFI